MKLTTRGNYAISALIELTKDNLNSCRSLKSIADDLALSENYLRQLFMELRKAHIVKSIRGVGGGYQLAKNHSEITVLEIVEAVEGKVNIIHCLDTEDDDTCNRIGVCTTRKVWYSLNSSIVEGLKQLTLKQLIEEYQYEKE